MQYITERTAAALDVHLATDAVAECIGATKYQVRRFTDSQSLQVSVISSCSDKRKRASLHHLSNVGGVAVAYAHDKYKLSSNVVRDVITLRNSSRLQ